MNGQQIQQFRQTLGMTQIQFAALLGTHPSTLSRWEKSKAKPMRLWVEKIKSLQEEYVRNKKP